MKNLKILLIIYSLFLTNINVYASVATKVSARERQKCDQKETPEQKSACHNDLNRLESEYKNSQAELSDQGKMKKDSNLLGAAAAAYGGYQIIGSIAAGSLSGSCYSCVFGSAVSVLAFLYKSSLSDKYEKKYNESKKQLTQLYLNGKSENNGDFQYQALQAEIAAIKNIYEAAKSKSKSHGNLQKMYGAVAAAAVTEIIVCSMPYSGCSGNVPPAGKTAVFAAIAIAMEAKAKGETDERVAKAKTALEATTKLRDKFHQFFEAKPDGETQLAGVDSTTAGSISANSSSGSFKSGTSTSGTITNIGGSGSNVNQENNIATEEFKADPNADCYAKAGDIVSCGEIEKTGSYEIGQILPASKYTSELEDKTNISGAVGILNKGFKGDFSELEKIGENAKMATAEDYFKENIKKILANPKNIDPDVIKDLEKSIAQISDEDIKKAIIENADPQLMAAITHRNLFGAGNEVNLEDLAKDTSADPNAKVKMTDGSLGDKDNKDSSAEVAKEDLLDLDGIDEAQTNLEGFEGTTPAAKYQAAINEYMKKKKAGDVINYNDIHTSKEDSIFEIISNRYKSKHVIRSLSTPKKDLQ